MGGKIGIMCVTLLVPNIMRGIFTLHSGPLNRATTVAVSCVGCCH